MALKLLSNDSRTEEEIREHYDIEKDLADRLRNATKQERLDLYSEVYDELFRRVTHHPLVAQKRHTSARRRGVHDSVRFLKKFINPDTTFLEIGPGDCALSFEIAKYVKKVYAVDVSSEITEVPNRPDNCEIIISDGCSIPVPAGEVDVVYSKDLMEHLHPNDALEQVCNISESLKPGGVYICRTPNGLSGPHDVSKFFDDPVATGLHLKEYTTTELSRLFRASGFSRVIPYVWFRGVLVKLPLTPVVLMEAVLERLPRSLRRAITRRNPVKRVLSRVIAQK